MLDHLRVLDFGRYVAGPYCATLLGYLGADVIRIEKPEGGEDRYIAPCAPSGEGGVFFQTACNKRSLTLRLGRPETRDIVEKLVAGADVVVVNLPAAARKRLGLDDASLRAIRPDVILATQSGFGDQGPYAELGGFDGVGQALSGAMYMTGMPGRPVKAAAPYVDFSTAVLSAFGVLAALIHRQRTGEGQRVDATLLGSALAAFGSHLAEESAQAPNRAPTGNRVQTSGPSDVIATADGHILVHTVGDGLFKRMAELLGRPEWVNDPRFQSDESRGAHRDELCAAVAAWAAPLSTAEALAALRTAGVPAGPIKTLREALADPQVAAMEFMREVAFPGMQEGTRVPDLPLRFSASATGISRRPPTLGEHTEEILRDLGYTGPAIAALREQNLI